MFNFERSGLSRKLTIISVLSTGSALLFVFIAFAASSVASHGESELRQLHSLAGVIGNYSMPALRQRDRRLAGQTLAVLLIEPDVIQAVLFDRDGQLLVRYTAPGQDIDALPLPVLDAARLAGTESSSERSGPAWNAGLRLYLPLQDEHESLGTLVVDGAPRHVWNDVVLRLALAAAASALAFAVAVLMVARFQHSIADPIARLIAAARQVSNDQSFTQRIEHQRSDELGTLIDSFNAMLAQVNNRDSALAQYRDQLERQVSLRTEQLEKAKNAAESASRAKSAFLATMSHEIRTPMNGVLGMTELLLATPLSERQRHYTSMVQRSGETLLVIINDILDFSKIEAGKLTVEYIHFNFRELLDDIDHVFSPQAQGKGLQLDFAIANDIPVAICGDPNRLRQVIVNLLGNAVKFTDAGHITVRVTVTAEDAQSVSLRFEVHDTGIGVSHEARARIFDSFSQADGSTTRKHGGTGLGLAISRQLVELMGGSIGVDTALGQGSVFWFAVRFDKRRVDAADPAFDPAATEGLRALVVDPREASRSALLRQLGAWRMAGSGAADAALALELLRRAATAGAAYDVVLLDMELPRTSGLALAATIKADPAIAASRLLLLSSERDAADSVQRRAAGVAFQLVKPARDCDLYDCIIAPLRVSEGVRLAPAQTSRPARPARARQRRKVLLAEDNPVNVEVACAMLEGLGLEVRHAVNGEQALDEVRSDDFDLILMDCQMPVMDGFAATAEIRRHEQQQGHARTLPIIAITANALQGDRESCLAAGMDDYLSKPFTQQDLGQTIARWISLPRAATVHHADQVYQSGQGNSAAAARPAAPPAPLKRAEDERQQPAAVTPAMPPLAQTARPAAAAAKLAAAAPQAAAQAGATPAVPAARPRSAPLPAPMPDTVGGASASAEATPPGVINRRALDNIRALSAANGAALLERVLHAYIDDTPAHLHALRQAVGASNAASLRRVAHSLKSSSANVGADLLAQLSRDMEALGRDEHTDGAAALLSVMEREFKAVRAALNTILEKES